VKEPQDKRHLENQNTSTTPIHFFSCKAAHADVLQPLHVVHQLRLDRLQDGGHGGLLPGLLYDTRHEHSIPGPDDKRARLNRDIFGGKFSDVSIAIPK